MLNELPRYNLERRGPDPELEEAIPSVYEANRDTLIQLAIAAEPRGEHWGGLRIGCAAMVYSIPESSLGTAEYDLAQPQFYNGANRKTRPGMFAYPERQCAEMQVTAQALDEGGRKIFIPAIVTVSEGRNTGERDTLKQDVLNPCKQCQVAWNEFEKSGIISRKTIIRSSRIENGKEVAFEESTWGELKEKLASPEEIEKRKQESIADLLSEKKQAVREFAAAAEKISRAIEQRIMFIEHSARSLEDKVKFIQSLRRERLEGILEEMSVCIQKIEQAMLSASEEGVPKEKLAESLDIKNIEFDKSATAFVNGERERILEQIKMQIESVFRRGPEIFE